jgi:hypothetical protein
MFGSLAKGARWTAGCLFSDLNPNNKIERSIDHRYHADFISVNKLINEQVKSGTFNRIQAREKLIQYRELVKAQYQLGMFQNITLNGTEDTRIGVNSLEDENNRVMEHVIKKSETNAPAVRNITTVISANDDDDDDSSSSRSRSSSISSVGSSTSEDSDDGSGYRSSRFSFASVSGPPPPPLPRFPERNIRSAGTASLVGNKQQLFSDSNSNGSQVNRTTGEPERLFRARRQNMIFVPEDLPQDLPHRVTVTSSGPDQSSASESIPLSAINTGAFSRTGMRRTPYQSVAPGNNRLTPVTDPTMIALVKQQEGQGDVTTSEG